MRIFVMLLLVLSSNVFAGKCVVVKGGKESDFDGKSIDGLKVEKKSLNTLNSEFSGLSIQEKVFSGAVQTCVSCEDNYVKCN